MATLTERLAILIDAKGDGAVREFRKVGDASDDLGKKSTRTGRLMESMGLSGVASTEALKAGALSAAAIGGAALVKFAADGVQGQVELANSVRNFQRASGASAEESSRFVAVLDDLGISAETGAGAISKLARNVDSEQLAEFGVQVERNRDGTVNLTETLLNVADAYANTKDPVKRAELSFAAFGKQGSNLIPVLEQGRKGLERFFEGAEGNRQILSQRDLDAAREYELALDALGDAISGLQRNAGSNLIPLLAAMANSMATVVGAVDGLTDKFGGLGNAVTFIGTVFPPFGGFLALGAKRADDAAKATDQYGGTLGGLKDDMAAVRKETEDYAKALERSYDAVVRLAGADLAHARALDGLEDAQAKVNEAQRAATEAVAAHGPASAQAKAATEGLDDANRDLWGQMLQVAEAEQRVAEQHAAATGKAITASESSAVYRTKLAELAGTLAPGSPLRTQLEGYIGQLAAAERDRVAKLGIDATQAEAVLARIRNQLGGLATSLELRFFGAGAPPGRQHGGPVVGGSPYIVGEAGPELFVPRHSGDIIPHGMVRASGSGGGDVYLDGELVGRILSRHVGNRAALLGRAG